MHWRRWVAGTAGVALALTAVVGMLHLPAFRPLLGTIFPSRLSGAACPAGYGKATDPARQAKLERQFSTLHRGTMAARSRRALGFELGVTSADAVQAWAKERKVPCQAPRGSSGLECGPVAVGTLGPPGSALDAEVLWFQFDAERKLTVLKALRRDRDAEAVAHAFSALEALLANDIGDPARPQGSGTAEALRRGALAQAMNEYRFQDYYAVVRATNMGDSFTLTEEYHRLLD